MTIVDFRLGEVGTNFMHWLDLNSISSIPISVVEKLDTAWRTKDLKTITETIEKIKEWLIL